MHAVIVNYEILDRLLESVYIDEGEDKDRVGAVSEFSDSLIEREGTFEIISN